VVFRENRKNSTPVSSLLGVERIRLMDTLDLNLRLILIVGLPKNAVRFEHGGMHFNRMIL
jgi:hypothetical protein